MPNYNDIKNMSIKELNSFLNDMQKGSKRICQKCGEFVLDKRTISIKKEDKMRTLCILCENCYIDLLDFLAVNDIDWSD